MALWPARRTTYNGIRMRSRLEARFAATLDSWDDTIAWAYEPQAFANGSGQYLPDFRVTARDIPDPLYIEVKPTMEAAQLVMARMQIIWDSEPDSWLSVAVPDEDDWDKWRYLMAGGPTGHRWRVVS